MHVVERKGALAALLACAIAASAGLGGCGADGAATAQAGDGVDAADGSTQTLRIGAVQGRGDRSEHVGERVELQGIVTGNFVAGLDGFFLQDARGEDDGDPATSDGIWIEWPRNSTPKVRRGDRVRVAGTVLELGPDGASQTALQASDLSVLGRGAAAATLLDAAPERAADWERYEGMWLRIRTPLTVSGNEGLLRFGELVASFDGRLVQPTERAAPGNAARAAREDNLRRRLVLDDNRNGEWPRNLWFLDAPLTVDKPLRVGSTLHGVEGILQQTPRGWRLQLTDAIERIEHAPRPPMPELPDGLRVASFNVLNYFNGNGRGGGFPTERGAASREELNRQRDKTVAAILALAPDIAALLELENDGYDARSSLAELVNALNAKDPKAGYRMVDTGEGPGTDAIRVALIYRPDRVVLHGNAATLVSGAFESQNRAPLAQSFAPRGGDGAAFTVVVNHFKSKGGCDEADAGNADQRDDQGCWNTVRVTAVNELHTWLRSDPTRSGTDRTVILGDLNAYGQEDPIRRLRELGWKDAFEGVRTSFPYSFVYDGYAGRLDHAFTSASLAPAVKAAVEWHINADESEAFDYRRQRRDAAWYRPDAYRASDHDPLLVVLDPGK